MKVASIALSLVVALLALVAVESASAQGYGYSYSWSSGGNCPQQSQFGYQRNCPPQMNCPPGMMNPGMCSPGMYNRAPNCPPQYGLGGLLGPQNCPQQQQPMFGTFPSQPIPRCGNEMPRPYSPYGMSPSGFFAP